MENHSEENPSNTLHNEPGEPLKIAGVDPEHGFAGGESQVLGLTLELLKLGHRAELICDPFGRLYERARSLGIVCHGLRIHNSVDLGAAIRFRRILHRERYDVVHFHTARAHAMAPFARGYGRALIVTRRMDYRPNRLFASLLFNRAVDGVAAISASVADALAESSIPRERVTIVPSGVDCERFHPANADERARARAALGLDERALVLVSVGALEERKGHRYLVEAVAHLIKHESLPLVCLIVGDGSQRQVLEKTAQELDVSPSIRLLGRMDDVREVLRAGDIFVFPSFHEGLGVAILEAAASGLPSVASRAGGISEVVLDGVTGMLVAPRDAGAMASGIARMARMPAERAQMGVAARERVVQKFSMGAMAAKTLALYRACLETNREKD